MTAQESGHAEMDQVAHAGTSHSGRVGTSRRGLFALAGVAAVAATVGAVTGGARATAAGHTSPAVGAGRTGVQRSWTLGVVGHHPAIDGFSYPASGIRKQVDLVEALGMAGYRVDFFLPDDDDVATIDWTWLDACVDQAQRRGIPLLAVVAPPGHRDDDWVRARTSVLAARYRGRVARYQILNECCNTAIRGPEWEGSATSDYDPVAYAAVRDRMRAVQSGVRSGDPGARTVVNITWKHTGFLDLLRRDGFGHDVNALDWYSGVDDLHEVLGRLQAMPQDEILIAELNVAGGASDTSTEQLQAQSERLVELLTSLDERPVPKLRGVFLYELFDQPTAPDTQAHYGMVPVGANGAWGAPKPVVRAMAPWLRRPSAVPGPVQCISGSRSSSVPVRPCTPTQPVPRRTR